MPSDVTAQLMVMLQILSATGAGVLASAAFDWLRSEYPAPTALQWQTGGSIARFAWSALHSPRGKRITPVALSLAIGAGLAGAMAAVSGGDALTAAWGALLSAVTAHIRHALTKSGEVTHA